MLAIICQAICPKMGEDKSIINRITKPLIANILCHLSLLPSWHWRRSLSSSVTHPCELYTEVFWCQHIFKKLKLQLRPHKAMGLLTFSAMMLIIFSSRNLAKNFLLIWMTSHPADTRAAGSPCISAGRIDLIPCHTETHAILRRWWKPDSRNLALTQFKILSIYQFRIHRRQKTCMIMCIQQTLLVSWLAKPQLIRKNLSTILWSCPFMWNW